MANNGNAPVRVQGDSPNYSGKESYSVVDIDSFEAMVHTQIHPELKGIAVVFVNKQNVIIAVIYQAKYLGVSRGRTKLHVAQKIAKIFEIPGKDGKSDQKPAVLASFKIEMCVRSLVKNQFPDILVSMKSKDEIYFELS